MTARTRSDRREIAVRVVSAIASGVIGIAAVAALWMDTGSGVTDTPGEVPSVAYLSLELLLAGFVGLIGAVRGSRPLIGAAGGLTLPLGLAGSLLAIPAVVLIGACGVVPTRRPPDRREFIAGLAVVVLGLSTWIVPALLASPGCWIAVDTPSGTVYEVVRSVPPQLLPGQSVAGCAEKMPPSLGFPIAVVFASAALAVAVAIARPHQQRPRMHA
jgi:hypothetical protein